MVQEMQSTPKMGYNIYLGLHIFIYAVTHRVNELSVQLLEEIESSQQTHSFTRTSILTRTRRGVGMPPLNVYKGMFMLFYDASDHPHPKQLPKMCMGISRCFYEANGRQRLLMPPPLRWIANFMVSTRVSQKRGQQWIELSFTPSWDDSNRPTTQLVSWLGGGASLDTYTVVASNLNAEYSSSSRSQLLSKALLLVPQS